MSEKDESNVEMVDVPKDEGDKDVRIDIDDQKDGDEKVDVNNPTYILNIDTTKRPDVFSAHKQMMDLALTDAGRWCYGVKAIDIWILADNGRLVKAEAGSWVDPIYVRSSPPEVQEALSCIYDPENPEYKKLREVTLPPGYGLAGTLWSDTNGEIVRSSTSQKDLMANTTKKTGRSKVIWRNVGAILKDEDNPVNPLLPYIVKAGFARAAGIPFNVRGLRGIVVYLTRKSVRMSKLQSDLNEEYMLATTEHIGAVMGLRLPRRLAAIERSAEVKKLFGVFRNAFTTGIAFQAAANVGTKKMSHSGIQKFDSIVEGAVVQLEESCTDKIEKSWDSAKDFFKIWSNKMYGGNIPPPPAMPWRLTIFVALFAFIQCNIMFQVSQIMLQTTGYGFISGQVGSGISILYTLTSAPSGQPRTVILGRLISIAVGMTLSYIPVVANTPLFYMRMSLTIALSSSLMARFRVSHPPGAVLALSFLQYQWHERRSYVQIGVLLLQDSLLCVIAAIFVNLNNSRSYPTYWGYLPSMTYNFIENLFLGKKEKEAKDL